MLRPGASYDPVGMGCAFMANLAFCVGIVLTKRLPAPRNPVAAAGWQLLLSGVVLIPVTLVAEGHPPALTLVNTLGLAYLSLVATAAASLLWFHGVRGLPSNVPPLLGLAAPITGATLGWVVLSQGLTALQLAGFALTTGTIAYAAVGTPSAWRRHAGDVAEGAQVSSSAIS